MTRFDGTCVRFANVDVVALQAWLALVPFEEWPQQHRLPDGRLRPAMVNDVRWHSFGAVTEGVTSVLLMELRKTCPGVTSFNPMLSAVMPGHKIPPHQDVQPPDWICRVHVPIFTNPEALMCVAGEAHRLVAGRAYLLNTTKEHSVENLGETPRVHYMFDVRGPLP